MPRSLLIMAGLLLVTGLAATFLPFYLPRPRGNLESVPMNMSQMQVLLAEVRRIADQINAPLSVIVALASLYYSRKGYMVQKRRAERD